MDKKLEPFSRRRCNLAIKRPPLAAAILADVWLEDVNMPVIDSLGEEFLAYVKDSMTVTAQEDGTVSDE